MMQHKYPFTLLHLTVEPEFIDVNVHPSKMELRFKDGENMYRVICQAVVDALSGKELIPNVSLMSEREERELEKKETAAAGNPIPGSGMSEPVKNAAVRNLLSTDAWKPWASARNDRPTGRRSRRANGSCRRNR